MKGCACAQLTRKMCHYIEKGANKMIFRQYSTVISAEQLFFRNMSIAIIV